MEPDTYRRMAELQEQHWWYEGRRRVLAALLARLPLPSPARVLEAGSGTGANLKMLAVFGAVQGFEPDDFARAAALAATGVDTPVGFLPDRVPFDGPFDLVCAFDVIEHIEDDAASVAALRGLTAAGGYAVFTVPAFGWLWSRHDDVNHHYRRYTRAQFAALLKGAGYEVEFISYYNFLLFPAVAGLRFLKKWMKKDGDPDDRMPRSAFVNACLRTVFAAERFWLARGWGLPWGVSIVAVGRRVV